jgi:hypothetical protein
MSPIYVPGKVVLAQTYVGIDDPDAAVYVAAVEAADGQSLETATKVAIHSFVKGCKQDGIWTAIKASCILAGARTLNGALVPLVGTAPTNVGGLFVSGDYNRETGLVGDGSTKYLDSNRNNNADPQNSKHCSCYITTANTLDGARGYMGTDVFDASGATTIGRTNNNRLYYTQCNSSGSIASNAFASSAGFHGVNRFSSAQLTARAVSLSTTANVPSQSPRNSAINVFRVGNSFTDARISFYSIGESLDLALLDARVSALITAFGVAIP